MAIGYLSKVELDRVQFCFKTNSIKRYKSTLKSVIECKYFIIEIHCCN